MAEIERSGDQAFRLDDQKFQSGDQSIRMNADSFFVPDSAKSPEIVSLPPTELVPFEERHLEQVSHIVTASYREALEEYHSRPENTHISPSVLEDRIKVRHNRAYRALSSYSRGEQSTLHPFVTTIQEDGQEKVTGVAAYEQLVGGKIQRFFQDQLKLSRTEKVPVDMLNEFLQQKGIAVELDSLKQTAELLFLHVNTQHRGEGLGKRIDTALKTEVLRKNPYIKLMLWWTSEYFLKAQKMHNKRNYNIGEGEIMGYNTSFFAMTRKEFENRHVLTK